MHNKYPDEIRQHTGWFVVSLSGKVFKEGRDPWGMVRYSNIRTIGIVSHGKVYTLPIGGASYFETKTGSATIGESGVQLLCRNIGYRVGNNEITLRVDEETGDCRLTVEEVKNA